ncbi:histone deacetylase family protein [Halanaeroarchaeum sulfurireducens]|uniref:Histone deacetylase superfamily protein n=1 Tax=Halanaeroarchaeum sulfurireducens TaxID=1604004 RepID=A0A0F7PBF3_9EURY|nr:histone deacetylase [Halanaeroarchaeum sulfurireducens]AKH96974.1 histone deacetylase superfamily protein [Halanaeroarchaeum sulfurireducens]ALG81375.1 histone deacetylase superfamily protein [Halanaeroarchaeum sulfurireducens]
MRFGFNDACLGHDLGQRHPENPDRIRAIREYLSDRTAVEYVSPAPASEADISSVHSDEYVTELRAFIEAGGGNWDPDTATTETTWEAALASAGSAIWAAEVALDGASGHETPFSLGRPPGHHATVDDAMGFCFLNNAAVAAQYARDHLDAERVAILDWDVHHGNGIQDIFYDRQDVFYVSVHEDGLYPGTGEVDETGEGPGAGTTLNVPLPPGAGDAAYDATLTDIVGPAIEDYDPDLLLVSAGFDAHHHDPISRMHVSTEGYSILTRRVRETADAAGSALGFVLEGGYGLETLAKGVGAVHDFFEGESVSPPEGTLQSDTKTLLEDISAGRHAVGLK